jgi:hypothetical protein
MSILIITDAISECYIVFSEYSFGHCISYVLFIHNRHFLPFGRADLTWLGWVGIGFVVARVRLGRLAVVHYSFMGHFLAAAATSTRE